MEPRTDRHAFLLEPHTIASWLARVDQQGDNALVQLPEPVNFLLFANH